MVGAFHSVANEVLKPPSGTGKTRTRWADGRQGFLLTRPAQGGLLMQLDFLAVGRPCLTQLGCFQRLLALPNFFLQPFLMFLATTLLVVTPFAALAVTA